MGLHSHYVSAEKNIHEKSQSEFMGLCFESLVGAELIKSKLELHYWREGDFEVDFVVRYKSHIIGIEVKTKKNKSSKSIAEFKKAFPLAQIIYINYENYSDFSKSIPRFFDKHIIKTQDTFKTK
jgi:predicted AAA+ superfamily ATPase